MTDLSDNMRVVARQYPEHADELRDLADKFDEAAKGYYDTPQTVGAKQFMGAWARARRRFCQVTGKPLI